MTTQLKQETRQFNFKGYCYWYDPKDNLYLKGHKPDDEMALIITRTEFENKFTDWKRSQK